MKVDGRKLKTLKIELECRPLPPSPVFEHVASVVKSESCVGHEHLYGWLVLLAGPAESLIARALCKGHNCFRRFRITCLLKSVSEIQITQPQKLYFLSVYNYCIFSCTTADTGHACRWWQILGFGPPGFTIMSRRSFEEVRRGTPGMYVISYLNFRSLLHYSA